MSAPLSEWAANAESDRRFLSEGITQQPGPFYNGNFSSSIWGTPPTPPLWRDTPPSSYGSCYVHQQASGLSSSDRNKMEPVTACKSQPASEQRETISNWTGIFSSGLHAGKQDLANSPFTFGFPVPPSAPSFANACSGSMYSGQSKSTVKSTDVSKCRGTITGSSMMSDKTNNECFGKERASSLEELSKSWATMRQTQAGLFGSLHGSFNSLAGDQTLASDGQQPFRHVHGNNVNDTEIHGPSVHDQQSGAGPDFTQSETAQSRFHKKDDACTFVFGSSSATGRNFDVGNSQEKCFNSTALGNRSTTSLASTKGRKHNKQKSTAAPMSTDSRPGPSKYNMDSARSSSSFLKFTMGVSDASHSQCPESWNEVRSSASLECDPHLHQTPSFSLGGAGSISQNRGSGAPFSAWQAFPSRGQTSLKDCNFTGSASSKGMSNLNSFDRKSERRQTNSKEAFWEELSKTSTETKRTSEEPKLTEFNLNSPGKLSAEELRDRAAKGGKLGEEIKRQKENQEPNFSFGNQKGSKPFVFGSSRAPCNTKHTVSTSDDIIKKTRSFRGAKDSKSLEDLVAKLGERMANLGKSHGNVGDHETACEESKNFGASESSSSRFCEDCKVKDKATYRSEDAANEFEKCDTLDSSIDEIREQLSKLGRLDAEKQILQDRTDAVASCSNGTMDGIALEHVVRELCEQISKLARYDDKREEEIAKFSTSQVQYRDSSDSSSILRAVEELIKQITKLNNTVRGKDENECSSSRLQQCATFTQSVEEVCERIKTLGKVDEKWSDHKADSRGKDDKKVVHEVFAFTACHTNSDKDSDNHHIHCSKAFVDNNQGSRAQSNPLTNVSYINMFSSNQAESSSSCPTTENPFIAGQSSAANPFVSRQPSMAHSFTAGQPSVADSIAARQPSMANPFTAGQPNPFTAGQPNPFTGQPNPFTAGQPSVANSFTAGQPSVANPFTAGQPNPFTAKQPSVASPFTAGQPSGANPFTAGQPNPFTAKQPSVANPFSVGQPSVANPFTAGQPSSISEVNSGTKLYNFERPSAGSSGNAGSSVEGFEFQGTKGPLRGTNMQRKNGRVCPNFRTREKANLARSRSAYFTSTSHSPGSPMDFSPCANKASPSSPTVPSCETKQEYVMSSTPKSEEAESMNVEEIRIATSNLAVGNDRGCSGGCQKGSGYFGRASDETNPFVLRQRKGTWKRAPRKGTAGFGSTEDISSKSQHTNGPQMGYGGFCGIDRGTASSFSSMADSKGVSSMEGPHRGTMWNSSSGYFFNEKVEKCTELKSGGIDKDQNAFSIARETPASSLAAKSAAAIQTCEKWRLRGNQAYTKGDYEKAEDYYTRGVNSVLTGDTSNSCIRASMLCYSNRAATRMAVGRMREALADCKQAIMLDSSFLRARLRAASCHLALGESKAAAGLFTECWRLAKEDSSFDSKVLEEAMDGVRKSQNFDNLLEKASKLLPQETSTDALAALQLLNEALTVSPFSEATQDMKAQALFSLRRFEDVVQLCQKTLPAAEENHGAHHHDGSLQKHSVFLNLWRWQMCGKALFQLGRLDESLNLLTKYEEATCGLPSDQASNTESMATTLSLTRDLLQHKAAGNEAFQAGRHAEAVEQYTAALSYNSESRPYNAVCFCNRAAASQALGHIADAIADCGRAIVLDSSYAKAISRRATLHEIIRDFGQTCNDLQRLIIVLEKQEALSKSSKITRAASKSALDLRQARERLDKATREMKKDYAVDHYLILGLDVSCSASDIKKAYRKAALKHHPDKAGQFLVRGENGDDGTLWKEVGDEVRRDAERLFKIIGESYAILSDPVKRAQYDIEYQISTRNAAYSEYYGTEEGSCPSGKSGRWRRDTKDDWSGRSPRYQRWQNGPDAAQPDTYSERGTRDSSKFKERRHRSRRSDYYYWDQV
ncbi:hypothetical protein GOP47_0030113 [Adiantum capillus-veneris]|nr:hypothetical protein GOP47_0030113 [Adiantum capillus-veneris]